MKTVTDGLNVSWTGNATVGGVMGANDKFGPIRLFLQGVSSHYPPYEAR